MNEQRYILPKDWKWVKLREVCSIHQGYGFPKNIQGVKDGKYPFFKVGDISKNVKAGFRYLELCENFINEQELIKMKAKTYPINTIVFAKIGEGLKLNRRAILKQPGIVDNNAVGVKAVENLCNDLFLYYFFVTVKLEDYSRATTVPSVRKSDIEEISFPLPPKPKQQAIVSKIEELFSELDKGIEQLKNAHQQLKTYRQSVLKWAFEGKLTNENVKDGELPEGWTMQKLNSLGTWKGGGTPSKANKAFWESGDIFWVSPKDMKSKIIYDTIDKITSNAIRNSSAKLISKGSILFVVRSGILRKTLPVAMTISDVTVNQDLQAFTPNKILPDFVYWFVQAKNEDIRKKCSKDGTTVESIESSLLKNYLMPVCSSEEQIQIVQEIENRLSVSDKMEESITQSLQQAEVLRQSILKKAFEGRLI